MYVTGNLTNSELEFHVNTSHLDFLTPESEDMNYLEAGAGHSDWGSLWELDRCAGEAGLRPGAGLQLSVSGLAVSVPSQSRPGPVSLITSRHSPLSGELDLLCLDLT